MAKQNRILTIRLYGERIGQLTRIDGDRSVLSFDQEYVNSPNRPALGLRFKNSDGQLITDFRVYNRRVMPYFSNLLPEGVLRARAAAMAGIKSEREFLLLGQLGRDLSGAVTATFEDEEDNQLDPSSIRPESSVPEQESNGSDTLTKTLRFSLAGVQLKFSANKSTPQRLTMPAHGIGGEWIVKLPMLEFAGVPENEFSMMTMARAVGINVPEIGLLSAEALQTDLVGNLTASQKVFVIKRFDRPYGPDIRHAAHIEDFAQIFDVFPSEKYDRATYRAIANVLAAECDQSDIEEFIRRLTFSILIGNSDMHLKNWSLIYPDRITPALAPAYDFVSTIAFIPDQNLAFKICRTKRYADIDLEEFAHLAEKANLPSILVRKTVIETCERFMEVWQNEGQHLPMFGNVRTAIDKHLKSLKLLSKPAT